MREELGLAAYVVPLGLQVDGKVTGQDKANWIENHIKKGYQTIYFIDDSEENRTSVSALKDKYPDIRLKVEDPAAVREMNEGPQFGVLYHFTQQLSQVLGDDTLRGPVSLTRSLDSYAAEWLGDQPYFIFDKDKLRTKYKITPFKDTSDNPDYEEISQYDEMEEVIENDITNLARYTIKVVLPYSDENWENALKEKNIPYEVTGLEEDLYNPEDKVLDYMRSSEYKAGMPDGPKDDIPRTKNQIHNRQTNPHAHMSEDSQSETGKILHAYDFDDTIARVKANIRTTITSPNGDYKKEILIPAENFPEESKELEAG